MDTVHVFTAETIVSIVTTIIGVACLLHKYKAKHQQTNDLATTEKLTNDAIIPIKKMDNINSNNSQLSSTKPSKIKLTWRRDHKMNRKKNFAKVIDNDNLKKEFNENNEKTLKSNVQNERKCRTTPDSPSIPDNFTTNKIKKRNYTYKNQMNSVPVLRQFKKLNLEENQFFSLLQRYVIDQNLLKVYGYPVESDGGSIEIFKFALNQHNIDSRPHRDLSEDSGQGSSSSSPISTDSESSEGCAEIDNFQKTDKQSYTRKQCVRCHKDFHVTKTGKYLAKEKCTYHWGKMTRIYAENEGFTYQYFCCNGSTTEKGCTHNQSHVWTGVIDGINGPYFDFVYTDAKIHDQNVTRESKIYSMDCEMCFTGLGLEATKITVVGYDGTKIYEHFIRPQAKIVDFNTRFSGITQDDFNSKSNHIKSLKEVQNDLMQLFNSNTILIGHGLDNDLRALRIVHRNVIDTSILFPHPNGFPYRRALKSLTKYYLKRDIQTSDKGHNSFEDSRACLELMMWKVRKECRIE